jgi:D-proline reductase (dithiol) PrdB
VTDRAIRDRNNHIDVIDYGPTTPTVAPPLEQARVAIVTTAGLRPDGVGTWSEGQGFTVLAHTDHHVTVAHASANFDRAGVAADLNVVYPIDRLDELAAQARIGSVASRHLSFMGAQLDHTFTTLRLDTGPAAAKLLLADEVDVVVLTPV